MVALTTFIKIKTCCDKKKKPQRPLDIFLNLR